MAKTPRGKFIVLEGTDGSGKGVQFELLKEYFRKKGIAHAALDFPQYGSSSAYFIEKYLNGGYGKVNEVDPRVASLFYAIDRFEMKSMLKEWLLKGKIVLANRYVASNMGHQGAKLANARARRAFIRWIYTLEYRIFKVPKPDLNIFLNVPPKIATELVGKKAKREYLKNKKRDIHENLAHIRKAAQSYGDTISLFPRDFAVIECAPKGKLLSIPEIHGKIVQLVKRHGLA